MAIEFGNELALTLRDDRLYAFGVTTPNAVHPGPFLAQKWRGGQCFAQLDEVQVDAGIALTVAISGATRSIGRSTPPPPLATSLAASKRPP